MTDIRIVTFQPIPRPCGGARAADAADPRGRHPERPDQRMEPLGEVAGDRVGGAREDRMSKKYFGQFGNLDDIASNFCRSNDWNAPPETPDGFPTDDDVLFASYGGAAYEGDALVIYERDGKLYEVHGSHCSCYGLEGQWGPEETSWAALAIRERKGEDEYYYFLHDHDNDAIAAYWALVDGHK